MSLESELQKVKTAEIIKEIRQKGNTISIDFSENNPDLKDFALDDTDKFEAYIFDYIKKHKAKFAIGGYLENRKWYARSEIFKSTEESFRNIHLGADIWAAAGTEIFSPLDAEVHSFADNSGSGNYGPTIILKHQLQNVVFYSLYGHLKRESLLDLEEGQSFKAGSLIGQIGIRAENGDWVPHLHFQLIRNMGNFYGDYPGVAAENELDFYSKNCPDPELVLKLM